jgi:hypothetical protein
LPARRTARTAPPAHLTVSALEDRLAPAVTTYRWTGGGGNDLYSTAANWDVLDAGGNVTGPGVPSTDGTAALLVPERALRTAARLTPADDLGGGADVRYASVTFRDSYSLTDPNGGGRPCPAA